MYWLTRQLLHGNFPATFTNRNVDINVSNKPLIIVAIAIATFTAPAHAELRLGVSLLGYGKYELESSASYMSSMPVERIQTDHKDYLSFGGNNVDVFGQWQQTRSDDDYSYFSVGVHLGYGQGGGEYSDGIPYAGAPLLDIDTEVEQGKIQDLLARVLIRNVDTVRPYIMLGLTTVELDITAYSVMSAGSSRQSMGKDNITLTGYKLVVGVEGGSLQQNWIWHAALEYVNYRHKETSLLRDVFGADGGSMDLFDRNSYNLTQKGIRFGISYRF